jgi:hypothetical protein
VLPLHKSARPDQQFCARRQIARHFVREAGTKDHSLKDQKAANFHEYSVLLNDNAPFLLVQLFIAIDNSPILQFFAPF